MTTIYEKIDKKLENLEKKAEKQAEKKIMKQRIGEMVRGLNFFEKLELGLKIFL